MLQKHEVRVDWTLFGLYIIVMLWSTVHCVDVSLHRSETGDIDHSDIPREQSMSLFSLPSRHHHLGRIDQEVCRGRIS